MGSGLAGEISFSVKIFLTMNKSILRLDFLKKYKDAGLLFMRVGVGFDYLVFHGWSKLIGGPDNWIAHGVVMPGFGIEAIYLFWGLMAALAETLGAVLFAVGLAFRPMAALIGITMVVAVYVHLDQGDPWSHASHAQKMVFVFFGLMMAGPGKYSLDQKFN